MVVVERFWRCATTRLAAMVLMVLVAAPAWSVDESWVLEASTADRGKDLLPEQVLKRVRAGEYRFKVVPADPARFRENYSKPFWEASAANAGKYDLDPKTCGLRDKATGKVPDWYFGYPFPDVKASDPDAGCRIAWNFTAAGYMGGGTGASFYLTGLDKNGAYRTIRTRLQVMAFVGRHGAPIPNPDRVAVKATSVALEPADVEGVSTLTVRHLDWEKPDDMWAFVPQVRRARRVNAASRSEPVAGMDIFADDINCYAGKVESYKWKLVGEGQILAPIVAQPYALPMNPVSPTRWQIPTPALKARFETGEGPGVPWLITEGLVFVPRPVWIVEGTSTDPYYNFGKVTMFFDKDMYRIYWKLVNNRGGEYFYNAMCGYTFGRTADGSRSAVLPTVVVGVNDKTNRAAIGGRPQDQVIEDKFDPAEFTLKAITRSIDSLEEAAMDEFRDRVAVITGGGGGIGAAMARAFAARKAKIVLADLDEAAAKPVADELAGGGADVLAVRTDVTDLKSVQSMADATERRFGGVHIVCNNAGVGVFGEIARATHADWQYAIDVNLWGVVHGVETFVPRLLAAGNGGHVVNTASMAGCVGMRWLGIYSATKFAVVGLTEALNRELKDHGIGVSVLCPMIVDTNINENSERNRPPALRNRDAVELPPASAMSGGTISPDEVARRVVRGIERKDLYIFTHPEQREILRRRAERQDKNFDPSRW